MAGIGDPPTAGDSFTTEKAISMALGSSPRTTNSGQQGNDVPKKHCVNKTAKYRYNYHLS
jgi:hypothetical protein